MKTKHKIITVISSFLILVGLIIRPLRVDASSGTYYLLDIGSYGQLGQYQCDSTGTGRSFKYVVTISLKANYNGSITITTSSNISNQDRIATTNCEMDNSTNTSFSLKIYNSSFCSFVYETDTAKTFTPSSQSLTKVSDINYYPQLGDINTKLTNIYNYIDDITSYSQSSAAYLGLIQTETSDISTSVDNIEATISNINTTSSSINTSVDNIEADIDNLRSNMNIINTTIINTNTAVADIKTSVSTIVTTISSMASDINSVLTYAQSIDGTLTGIAQNLQNLYARVNEINGNVALMKTAVDTISSTVTTLLNTLQNVDSLIDTISWQNLYSGDIGWSSTYNGSFNTANNSRPFQSNKDAYFNTDIPISADVSNSIIKVKLPYAITSTTANLNTFSFDLVNTSDGKSCDAKYYLELSNYSTLLYFYDFKTVPYSSSYKLYVKGTTTVLYPSYYKYSANGYVDIITNNDIEYWQLLNHFINVENYKYERQFNDNLTDKLEEIIDAINNINVTVNVTEQEITNITNNFDNDITTIHNVEVDFDNSFVNYDGSISDNDITLNLTPYSPTFSFIKANVTRLWSSDLIKIPITLSCLVFIFLVILG